jgi:hypothetical protein
MLKIQNTPNMYHGESSKNITRGKEGANAGYNGK